MPERAGAAMEIRRCVLLEVIALVDLCQSIPSVATQLSQSDAQNPLALQRMNEALKRLVGVKLPEVFQAQPQAALVFCLVYVLHFPILELAEKLVNEFVVSHQALLSGAFLQSSVVDVDLRELQRRLDLVVFRRERQVGDQLLGRRVVLSLKVITVRHVPKLSGLLRRDLEARFRELLDLKLFVREIIAGCVVHQDRHLLVLQLPSVTTDGSVQELVDVFFLRIFGASRFNVFRDVVPVAEPIVLNSLQQPQLF